MSQIDRGRRRRGRPRAHEGGLVRAQLIEQALQLFAERGFDGASVHDIAAAANVSDAALYAHFAGKRALYDELFREAGPAAVVAAVGRQPAEIHADPALFVAALVDDLALLWSKPRERRFTSIFVRELAARSQAGLALQPAIEAAQIELARVFARWRSAGTISSRSSDVELAWELIAPLIYIRFVYMQAHATRSECKRGLDAARRHARYFLNAIGVDEKT